MRDDIPRRQVDWTGHATREARFFKRAITTAMILIVVVLAGAIFW